MTGRCCTLGGWDFSTRWERIGWNSKPDYQTIFCRMALKTGLYDDSITE
jgi:hypothetical protein